MKSLQAQLQEVQEQLANDPTNEDLKAKESEILAKMNGSANPSTEEEEAPKSRNAEALKKFEELKDKITSKKFKSQNVFFSFVQDAQFDPHTGKPLVKAGRPPFIQSCNQYDVDNFVNFHKKQVQTMTCLYHPEGEEAKKKIQAILDVAKTKRTGQA